MTRLELWCDLFTKLPLGSKVKQGSCAQKQNGTISFFLQSPDSELKTMLAETTELTAQLGLYNHNFVVNQIITATRDL